MKPDDRDARPSLLALWCSAALHLLSWLPAAAMCFYAKNRLLEMHGYRIVARSIGRLGADDLTRAERVAFYKDDAVLVLVVVPLLLVIALRYMKPMARSLLSGTVGLAVFLITFLQMNTFDQVGRFGTLDMFQSAVAHLDQDPELLGHFLSPRTLVKILVPSLMIVTLAWLAGRADPRRVSPRYLRTTGWHVGRACLLALLPLLIFGSAMRFDREGNRTSYHESVLLQILSSLRGSGPVDTTVFERLSDREIDSVYRDFTGAPEPVIFPEYFGKAAGKNVVVFVCETGPARYLDVAGDLSDLPTLERLRERAFIAPRHYSTYPYTNRALFSLYSSLYPSSLTRNFNQQLPRMELSALPSRLHDIGYTTAIFSPVALTFENDNRMYAALGFEHFVSTRPDSSLGPDEAMHDLDRQVLVRMRRFITGMIERDQRFFVGFHPQVGHAPWPDVSKDGSLDTVAKRGRSLFQLQDRWLAKLVDVLEALGQLDDTIIVFTADHGIRTRLGDPELVGGRVDDYSFHVPLLIWAPMALEQTQEIPWLTSHIDVAPTLEQLLGLSPHLPAQGSPLWDERVADRTTFFFGRHYLGADGYHAGGRMVMRAHMANEVYETTGSLSFDDADMVPLNTPRHHEVRHAIRRMVGLQETWVRHFSKHRKP